MHSVDARQHKHHINNNNRGNSIPGGSIIPDAANKHTTTHVYISQWLREREMEREHTSTRRKESEHDDAHMSSHHIMS